jgi:hypothetical protein
MENKNNEKVKVELIKIAKLSCKKCHGTGYIGVNRETGKYVICQCALKKLQRHKIEKLIKSNKAEV